MQLKEYLHAQCCVQSHPRALETDVCEVVCYCVVVHQM